jgi:hypothetical protein
LYDPVVVKHIAANHRDRLRDRIEQKQSLAAQVAVVGRDSRRIPNSRSCSSMTIRARHRSTPTAGFAFMNAYCSASLLGSANIVTIHVGDELSPGLSADAECCGHAHEIEVRTFAQQANSTIAVHGKVAGLRSTRRPSAIIDDDEFEVLEVCCARSAFVQPRPRTDARYNCPA